MRYVLDKAVKKLNLRFPTTALAKATGYATGTVSEYMSNKKPISDKFVSKMIEAFPELVRQDFLEDEAEPIQISSFITLNNHGNSFRQMTDGSFEMSIKLVEPYAYAGYLTNHDDTDYIDSLPDHYINVDELKRGYYRAFRVKGDSMDYEGRKFIAEGAIVSGRSIAKEFWRDKLHLHKWPLYIIVTREHNILVKEITAHDVEKARITCHSYNGDKSLYPDFQLSLNEVVELYNVVDIRNKPQF